MECQNPNAFGFRHSTLCSVVKSFGFWKPVKSERKCWDIFFRWNPNYIGSNFRVSDVLASLDHFIYKKIVWPPFYIKWSSLACPKSERYSLGPNFWNPNYIRTTDRENVQILVLRQFVQINKLLKSYPRLLRNIKVHVLTFKIQILDLLQRVQVVVHKVLKNPFIDA